MKAGSFLTNPQNFCQTHCHFQGMLTRELPTCPSSITRSDCPKAGSFHGRLRSRPANQGGLSLQCLPFLLRDTFTSTNQGLPFHAARSSYLLSKGELAPQVSHNTAHRQLSTPLGTITKDFHLSFLPKPTKRQFLSTQ